MKTRFFLIIALAVLFAACSTNDPTKKIVGLWEPVGYQDCDMFIISADSIKAIQNGTGLEHYQCHYKMLNDSIAELERCWMEDGAKDHDYSDSGFQPELYFFAEVKMYIDEEGFLIISPFDIGSELSQTYPNYATLKLKRQ